MSDEKKTSIKKSPVKKSQDQLDHLKRNSADLPSLLEYAHSVGGFSIVPTNEGSIKRQAMMVMQEQTEDKLSLIYEQMQLLAKQAREIQDRVQVSEKIYHANFKFDPLVGKTYFLYSKSKGTFHLSMIGPDEWSGVSPLGKGVAKVKLLADHTWKVIENFEEKKKDDNNEV